MIPTKIILHHSATKDSGSVSWNAIRRFHVEQNKWEDIGYHAGVELVTDAAGISHYEMLLGRTWDRTGAHTKGQNSQALGLCFVGDFDIKEPPKDQLLAGAKIVRMWMDLYNIPVHMIFGHRDFAQKSCPGRMFNIGNFKDLL